MITLSDAIKAIVGRNPFLQLGLFHKLFNLSQLSRFLLPQVKARGRKDVSPTALLMALSRYQRALDRGRGTTTPPHFSIDNIIITSGLCAVSFANTPEVSRALAQITPKIHKHSGFITITQGIHEIRVIVTRDDMALVRDQLPQRPVLSHSTLASLGVTFKKNYLEQPGFFYAVFQQLYFQGINIVEIASTANELVIYVDETDVRLAFDTLYNGFLARRSA